ncbi:hypothetical protein V8B97DRAFT_1986532 [Scleroderma yunnanense]
MLGAPEAKIFALLVTAVTEYPAITPPNMPTVKERYMPSRLSIMGHRLLVIVTRTILWTLVIAEVATAFSASDLCPHPMGQLIASLLMCNRPSPQITPQISTLSPGFLIGTSLIISGSLLRVYCFRVLGQFFTFELSIREDHKLVTEGPYSIVRHPSYTAAMFMLVGRVLSTFDRNSWLVASSGLFPYDEISLTHTLWSLRVFALLLAPLITIRMNSEDEMLEKTFGEEWRAWRQRVPYRLVPGVY